MTSRELRVHLVAVGVALLLLVAAQNAVAADSGLARGLLGLLSLGLVFGGAHLYLAVRGEDGMVPVAARWRYVGTLAVLLGAGVLSLVAGDRTLGPVDIRKVGTALVALTLATYLLLEAIAGYRGTEERSG